MAAAEDDDTGIFGQAALLLELSLEEGQPQLQQDGSQAPSGSDQLEHMLATLAAAAAAPEALVGLLCWAAPRRGACSDAGQCVAWEPWSHRHALGCTSNGAAKQTCSA